MSSIRIFLAANSATKEEIELLESLVHKMDQSIQKGDIPGYTDYNRAFHNQLYRSSHSPVLIEIIESLYMRSENSKMTFHHNPERLQASNDEHRAIVVALQNRNAEEAAETLRVQKEQGFQIVLNALRVSRLFMGEVE
ncbi:GntR family transcriptional regulator [Peribacillus asahii]|uniref:GntR family transcriptional regulator n=1 Tax=Peribacillus asahii TaxID=228899 RepID=UPI0038089610